MGPDHAEDITADVFHAAAQTVRSGQGERLGAPWLMTVARNKVIDHWRRRERRTRKLHLLWERGEEEDPYKHVEANLDRDLVIAALDELTSRHRLLLMLHYVDGLSSPQLAADLGSSVAAVESALARARRAFKSAYMVLEEHNERL